MVTRSSDEETKSWIGGSRDGGFNKGYYSAIVWNDKKWQAKKNRLRHEALIVAFSGNSNVSGFTITVSISGISNVPSRDYHYFRLPYMRTRSYSLDQSFFLKSRFPAYRRNLPPILAWFSINYCLVPGTSCSRALLCFSSALSISL